jgi:DNA-binding PadR family transcriptional regulator
VILTPSGITRLLDRLERCGYGDRAACTADRRVTYAVLTDAGLETLLAARETHLEGVRALFADRYDEQELETLAELLSRRGPGLLGRGSARKRLEIRRACLDGIEERLAMTANPSAPCAGELAVAHDGACEVRAPLRNGHVPLHRRGGLDKAAARAGRR